MMKRSSVVEKGIPFAFDRNLSGLAAESGSREDVGQPDHKMNQEKVIGGSRDGEE
jgi:hypothetical protein